MKIKFKILAILATAIFSNATNVLHNEGNKHYDFATSHKSITNNKKIINNVYTTSITNILADLEKDISINSVNVLVNSDKNINYSYEIFYNKYISKDNIVTTESTNNQYQQKFDSNSKNVYLNGHTTSITTNNGKDIGGIPLDQIKNLYVKMSDIADNEQKLSIKLNGNENTIQKNTQVKVGTEYFSINATGTKDSPTISIYKNYVDAFTNKKIAIQVGKFLSNNPKPNSQSAPMPSWIGAVIFAGILVFVAIVVIVSAVGKKVAAKIMQIRHRNFYERRVPFHQQILGCGDIHEGIRGPADSPQVPIHKDDVGKNSGNVSDKDYY